MAEVFDIRESGKVAIVDLHTELDRLSVLSIKTQLRGLVMKKRKNKLIINFAHIERINSTIIGALVGLQHLIRGRDGMLALCGVNPSIHRTFDLVGASRILQIYGSEEEALASF